MKRTEEEEKHRKCTWTFRIAIAVAVILFILCFGLMLSDGTKTKRKYEPDEHLDTTQTVTTDQRVNLSFQDEYVISEDSPKFQIGYPDQNEYDITLTFADVTEDELYQTEFIAPGTNIVIDGTKFCKKGTNPMTMRVAVYDHESGELINGNISIKMKINYK